MSNQDEVKKLISIHHRRLQKLKEQQAVYGISTDPSVLLEIEDIEAEIEKLQSGLEETENEITGTSSSATSSETSQIRGAINTMAGHSTANAPHVDFVIITALEEERDAVLAKIPNYKRVMPSEDDIRVYYEADLPTTFPDGSVGSYKVVVMPLLGMGRVQATTATNDAIRRWQPNYVIMVGIAGGVHNKGVKLGDIIVADQVVDYELQKLTDTGSDIRWQVYPTDPKFIGYVRNLVEDDWLKLITVKRPETGKPKRHVGPIASGDKVIAFEQALTKYRETWSKLIGVEMEAGGVAASVLQAANQPKFFMIRGVSDLADEEKNSDYVEEWRSYACDVAAAYTVGLLQSGPMVSSNSSTKPTSSSKNSRGKKRRAPVTVSIDGPINNSGSMIIGKGTITNNSFDGE